MLRRSLPITQAAAAAATATRAQKEEEKIGKNGSNAKRDESAPGNERKAASRLRPLLGYPIRRAAAEEMLYGGVRVAHLSPSPFPLQLTHSEDMAPPSRQRERHDLALEMQLPRDGQMGHHNVSINITRQLGYTDPVEEEAETHAEALGECRSRVARSGFRPGEYFGNLFHAERHHNSSLPYAAHDTNNVLGLRLFPINLHVRYRVEGVRVRTEDLLARMRDYETCAAHGLPLQSPLPLHARAALQERARGRKKADTLYSGSLDHRKLFASTNASGNANGNSDDAAAVISEQQARTRHLRGGPSHPRPQDLSVFTRPQDVAADTNIDGSPVPPMHTMNGGSKSSNDDTAAASTSTRAAALQYFCLVNTTAAVAGQGAEATSAVSHRSSFISRQHPQYWVPLQMMKPMGHAWSASVRSSGARGPSMQLMQERLDQKGFGWKRKSRSLWQQDIATAGFRPHRYF